MIVVKDEHIVMYEEYLRKQQLSKNTINIYIREANCLKNYFNDEKIEENNLNQYYLQIKSKYKAVTANLYLIACQRFLNFCNYTDCKIKLVKIQPQHSINNVITKEDYYNLLACAEQHGKRKACLIIRTLACTGIRVSELCFITVSGLKAGYIGVFNKQKYRDIYLPNKLVDELCDYCNEKQLEEGPVFLGNKGTAISRVGIWEMLQRIAKKCGVNKEKAHPHSLRHLFAKTYMEQYGNLTELADILGHSSIEITRRYTMTSVEEKRKRIENMLL